MISIKACAFALIAVAVSLPPLVAAGQTLTTLHAFQNKGRIPHAGVINLGSHLVGTTFFDGLGGSGTVFRIPLAGGPGETTFHVFSAAPDGGDPQAPFLEKSGVLYGTTVSGGSGGGSGYGTVFTINPNGTNYAILHSFLLAEGTSPQRGLIYAGGNFYGTTAQHGPGGWGTVYKMDSSGAVTVLYAFTGGADGATPLSGLLKIGNYLYGNTGYGGAGSPGSGTVFRIKTDGTHFQVLHTFVGGTSDGASPYFSDLVSFGGFLWGTTLGGGQWGQGVVYKIDPDGNNYSVVHVFAGAPGDAGYSTNPMLLVYPGAGGPGALYAVTPTGGAFDKGAVFKIDVNGVETMLYSFSNGDDGGIPETNLINVPDGGGNPRLYGTTETGGHGGYGTVFEFTP